MQTNLKTNQFYLHNSCITFLIKVIPCFYFPNIFNSNSSLLCASLFVTRSTCYLPFLTIIFLSLIMNSIESGLFKKLIIGLGTLHIVLCLPSSDSFTLNFVSSFFQRVNGLSNIFYYKKKAIGYFLYIRLKSVLNNRMLIIMHESKSKTNNEKNKRFRGV